MGDYETSSGLKYSSAADVDNTDNKIHWVSDWYNTLPTDRNEDCTSAYT